MDLLDATADLVKIPSESHHEGEIVDHIEAELAKIGGLEVTRVGDNLIARTDLGRDRRIALVGHTDTVPAQGNEQPSRVGDELWGLGTVDMKGALAVFLDLARAIREPALDVTYVFYAREEVAGIHSGLEELLVAVPHLLNVDAAIIGEPTSAQVEAGCQGTLRVVITMRGKRAHTARAWMGSNAVHRLAPILGALSGYVPRRPLVAGLAFHEALQAVAVTGGVAGNVVPDTASVTINHRFAPDRTSEDAISHVRAMLDPFLEIDDEFVVQDVSAAAWPGIEHPLLETLVTDHGCGVSAKLGWTDVARFAARGIPAVNFGPGDAALAHTAEEHVSRADLNRVRTILEAMLLQH